MKKLLLFLSLLLSNTLAFSQVTNLAPQYNIIDVGTNSTDWTRYVILLHEMYNGSENISNNYAIGTITAMRGNEVAGQRLNVVHVNASSAYNSSVGSLQSFDLDGTWKLKTCNYNGKKYLAVEVPYSPAHHNWGFKFCGWVSSSGEALKRVAYEVDGTPYNQNLIDNIQDFVPNLVETHAVANLNITGNVAIGTTDTKGYKLAVAGNMIAESVKVQLQGSWSDFVFAEDYKLPTLQETAKHIKEKGHLPGIPSAAEVKANGIDLGEMNAKLLQKIEELTLHLIEQNKEMNVMKKENEFIKIQFMRQQKDIEVLKSNANEK